MMDHTAHAGQRLPAYKNDHLARALLRRLLDGADEASMLAAMAPDVRAAAQAKLPKVRAAIAKAEDRS